MADAGSNCLCGTPWKDGARVCTHCGRLRPGILALPPRPDKQRVPPPNGLVGPRLSPGQGKSVFWGSCLSFALIFGVLVSVGFVIALIVFLNAFLTCLAHPPVLIR